MNEDTKQTTYNGLRLEVGDKVYCDRVGDFGQVEDFYDGEGGEQVCIQFRGQWKRSWHFLYNVTLVPAACSNLTNFQWKCI